MSTRTGLIVGLAAFCLGGLVAATAMVGVVLAGDSGIDPWPGARR